MNETLLEPNGVDGVHRKSPLLVGVIVLGVIAVAAIAYSVYARQQNSNLSSVIATRNSQIAELQKQAAATAKTTPVVTPSVPAATYLDIKELGVKIKITDDIKDAVYSYDASNPSAPTARISTQSLIDKSAECDTKNEPAFGGITKKQSLAMAGGGTLTVNNTTVFQVGSSYFVYSTPQAPCTQTTADQAVEASLLASFKRALTTLQSDQ